MMKLVCFLSFVVITASAFTAVPRLTRCKGISSNTLLHESSKSPSTNEKDDWESEEFVRSNLDRFLSTRYPDFYQVLALNPQVEKVLQESSTGVTVFMPNAAAYRDLGSKKQQQLFDPRNLETTQKMAAYHVISETAVPVTRLFQEDWTVPKTPKGNPELSFRGVMTMGGEVAVSRSKSGGFLGLMREEDGGVIIGPSAKIVASFNIGKSSIVHEVDGIVSPVILWRYFDILRIPGF